MPDHVLSDRLYGISRQNQASLATARARAAQRGLSPVTPSTAPRPGQAAALYSARANGSMWAGLPTNAPPARLRASDARGIAELGKMSQQITDRINGSPGRAPAPARAPVVARPPPLPTWASPRQKGEIAYAEEEVEAIESRLDELEQLLHAESVRRLETSLQRRPSIDELQERGLLRGSPLAGPRLAAATTALERSARGGKKLAAECAGLAAAPPPPLPPPSPSPYPAQTALVVHLVLSRRSQANGCATPSTRPSRGGRASPTFKRCACASATAPPPPTDCRALAIPRRPLRALARALPPPFPDRRRRRAACTSLRSVRVGRRASSRARPASRPAWSGQRRRCRSAVSRPTSTLRSRRAPRPSSSAGGSALRPPGTPPQELACWRPRPSPPLRIPEQPGGLSCGPPSPRAPTRRRPPPPPPPPPHGSTPL